MTGDGLREIIRCRGAVMRGSLLLGETHLSVRGTAILCHWHRNAVLAGRDSSLTYNRVIVGLVLKLSLYLISAPARFDFSEAWQRSTVKKRLHLGGSIEECTLLS